MALRVERDADGNVKYRSPDKTAAREQAMKHFGLYERDNSQKPPRLVVHAPGEKPLPFEPIPKKRRE